MRTTILNTDSSLISVVSWQQGMILLLKGVIQPLEFYDDVIRSGGGVEHLVPKVVMVKKYIKHRRKHSPTKKNILLRDNYTCQYCGSRDVSKLTIDHVMPSSKGGGNTWENLTAACMKCNYFKADRTPEEAGMHLKREPFNPMFYSIKW